MTDGVNTTGKVLFRAFDPVKFEYSKMQISTIAVPKT